MFQNFWSDLLTRRATLHFRRAFISRLSLCHRSGPVILSVCLSGTVRAWVMLKWRAV